MSDLAGYNHMVTVLNSSTSADYTIPALRAPFGGATLKAVYAMASTTLNASTADFFSVTLLNGGSTGTATAAIGTVGGTTGWTAATSKTATLNTDADELSSGEWLMVKYDETGTVAVADVTIVVEWVHGKG